MTLGERISTFRRRQGLSQEALAEKLGVSRQSVSKWERNESLPETDKLPLLAQALGISLDLLLNGEEAAPSPSFQPFPPFQRGSLWSKITWLFQRWGWVGGLVLAGYGVIVLGIAILWRMMMGQMLPPEVIFTDGCNPFLPVELITGAIMVMGGILMVGGLASAIILYRRRR